MNSWLPGKCFIYKTYLTDQVCLQCRTVLPNPMCPCEPQLLLWFWLFHRDPLKGKWWMRSCQASVPWWPWIHPVICYTANHDSDEHKAGSWRHPYSLPKKRGERIKPASLQCVTQIHRVALWRAWLRNRWRGQFLHGGVKKRSLLRPTRMLRDKNPNFIYVSYTFPLFLWI